jgi:hypothetical protein
MKYMTRIIRNDRGAADSKTPTIILIVVILIIAFLAFKFVPVKVRSMKFNNDLQELVNPNLVKAEKITEEVLIKRITKLARDLNLPKLDPKKNMIIKRLPKGYHAVTVKYVERISLPIYGEYVWPFEFKAVQIR